MNFLSTIKSEFYDFEKLNLPTDIEKLQRNIIKNRLSEKRYLEFLDKFKVAYDERYIFEDLI